MIKDLVKDWMTSEPIGIAPDTTVLEAHQIMKENAIRRLPVVGGEEVVGIVTLGDVREAGPSDATSLSIYELNYLLARLTVEDIMTSKLFWVSPDTTLYAAAKLMLENKIGGLPVLDGGALVGIITESDIFRAVMEILEGEGTLSPSAQ